MWIVGGRRRTAVTPLRTGRFLHWSRNGCGITPTRHRSSREASRPRDQRRYLLDYSFKSPRLCCSSKDECHLSGWQIDKSGGHFEFSPTGHYPEDFAFPIDWFNRVDTNLVDAITIAHQVARREAGMITLEFRFKHTVVVDGISWQPSDPQEATFCLTTTNGNLCHATQ